VVTPTLKKLGEQIMKLILPIAILGALVLSGCERTVVTPPNAAVVTPPAVVNNPVPVPGPSGPPGPQGAAGSPGEPGKSGGDTVVIAPPGSSTTSSSTTTTPSDTAKN
jgi:hypothetical protein